MEDSVEGLWSTLLADKTVKEGLNPAVIGKA